MFLKLFAIAMNVFLTLFSGQNTTKQKGRGCVPGLFAPTSTPTRLTRATRTPPAWVEGAIPFSRDYHFRTSKPKTNHGPMIALHPFVAGIRKDSSRKAA